MFCKLNVSMLNKRTNKKNKNILTPNFWAVECQNIKKYNVLMHNSTIHFWMT